MIIGTYGPREIGEIVAGPTNGITEIPAGGRVPVTFQVPYCVLREATEAEWIAEQIADGYWGPLEQLLFRLNPPATHWYEVSVD